MSKRSPAFAEGRTPTPAEYAAMWPTPRAGNPGSRPNGKGGKILAEEVKKSIFPTPDVRGFTNDGSLKMLAEMADSQEEFSGMTYRAGQKKKSEFWPTPRNNKGPSKDKRHLSLDGAVQIWPTPTAQDFKHRGPNSKQQGLADVVRYPTPGTSGLSNGSGNCEAINRLYQEGKITEEERKSMRSGNGGQLNPQFVAWLMGYPLAWTDMRAEFAITPTRGRPN
jgi:hypothetical protein